MAGDGTAGYTGDGGPATSATFDAPIGIAIDTAGSLYVSDFHNDVIRKLSILNSYFPTTIVASSSAVQNVYLQTTAAETITSITAPQSLGGKQEYSIGTITGCTINGTTSNPEGTICIIPITFTPAYPGQRRVPLQVVTSTGNINFGLTGIGRGPLAALTPGIITTVAGNGTGGYTGDGGPATSAELNTVFRQAIDSAGNIYFAEYNDNRIRKIAAGTGIITTVAGNGTAGFSGDGGPATSAKIYGPQGVFVDSAGNLYIADFNNSRIRKVNAATGVITTVAGNGSGVYSGDGGPATSAGLVNAGEVIVDSAGNLYITDYLGCRIRKVAAGTGIITTVAGNGTVGYSGDGGAATSAEFHYPGGAGIDSAGNLYITDQYNNRVRKVSASTGIITTVAGNGTQGYSGDGGLATSAELYYPGTIAIDSADNVYFSDQFNNRVRKIDAKTQVITTLAGTGPAGFTGDGGAATRAELGGALGIALDSAGNLYIADYGNNRIRKVDITQSAMTYPTPTTVGTSDTTDNPQTAVISNIGNAGLTVPPPSSGFNPTVPASFAFDSSSTCPQLDTSSNPQTLASGANCTIEIDFEPVQAGALTGSALLTDTSLDAATATQTIHLLATGVAASTTTTVTSSLSPSVYAESVTFTATVAPTTGTALPTGTVQFSVDGTNVGSAVTLNNGTATYTTTALAVGTHAIKAVYTPDSTNFTASNGTVSQVVIKATLGQNGVTNIALTSAPNPSAYGQLVTFTATVPSGATGTVQFEDGTTVLGTGTISGATAAFTTSTLAVGTHSVTAVYSGDVNYNTATSAVDSQVVNSSTFPATPVHSTSVAENVFVTIPSTETITSISIPQSQGGQQEFTIESITGCTVGASNPAGTVCQISITFTPEYPGQRWVPLQVVASGGNFNVGLSALGLGPVVALTPGVISTFAGNGTAGYAGDGVLATSAQLNSPVGVAFDSAGNLYIGDNSNSRVRKVNAATGIITTVVGNGTAGYSGDGGPATSAELNGPEVVALDSAGNLYIAEYYNNRIRKVAAATGIITTVAGNGTQNYSGDGGSATSAALWSPTGVAVDSANNLYIADFGNHRIRKVTAATGIITTVAGNGTLGYSGDGGPATGAELADPTHVVLDSVGNLIIADPGNNRVRKVTVATGIITTVAGNGTGAYAGDGGPATSAALHNPEYLTLDSADNLYIGDYLNNRVRKVNAATGIITTVAGNGTGAYSGDGGPTTSAELHFPSAIAFDNVGNLYVSDLGNSRIRKLDVSQSQLTYPTPTVVGTSDATDDPQTAIVSNIGNASLTVPPSSSGNNPNVSTNFALDAVTTCPQLSASGSPQMLASGADCTYAVDFQPAAVGPLTGSAVLTDNMLNVAGSTQTIHLTGTGVAVGTTTALSGSPNPSVYSQLVTFTATVSPTAGTSVPTGAVQFSVDGTAVGGPVTLVNGAATFTSSTLTIGTHSVKAVYTPDTGNFTTSIGSVSQVVNPAATTTTVASSVNPSAFMQSVTFTATVAPTAGTALPTGTVQFSVDGTNVGSPVTLGSGTASFAITTLAVGVHTVMAVYTPDTGNFTGSNGSTGQRVGAVATSTTTLSVAPASIMYGDTATLTAVVAPSFATGTVSFYEGTTLLGTASLDNTGTAILPISTLNAGVHTITATYNGDPGVPASTSNPVQLTVTQRTAPGGGPAITVTVNDASRSTIQANPPFTYSAAGQLVNGDTYATAISGTPSYSTAAGTTPGTYSITVTGLTSANYSIAFLPGTLTVTAASTTTTLVASPSSTQYGDPVTLTATVTSGATGTVSFYDGSVLLGTGAVSNGIATLTTTTLVAGAHTITVVYNGDATYASSQSGPATVTVSKLTAPGGGAALTITVQNESRQYNTADPQPSYVVTGTLVNGDTYATAVTGTPVYSSTDTPTSPAGSTFPISVSGLSSANYTTAIVNGTLTIVTAPTTTTLATSTTSAQYGDPVTLTATVSPSGATGTVLFMQGAKVLGTGTVSGGVATLTTSTLPAGSYTITSSYQGDTDYGASTSGSVTFTVTPRTAPGGGAALTVTVANASRAYGQGNPAFTYSVTGTLVNGDTYATAVTGVPVYSTTAIATSPAGTYPISVAGLNSNNYLIAFVNGTLTVGKATLGQNGLSDIILTSSPNPSNYGQSVTFTATVPSGVTGTVQFMDGTTLLGTAALSGTTASLTTSALTPGTHLVTAVYGGDVNYNPATSAVDSQVVNQESTTTTVASSLNPSPFMQSVTFTATVAPTSGTDQPTGTVQFSVDGTNTGSPIMLSGGTASFTISTLAVGVHTIAATYTPDTGDFTGSNGSIGQRVGAVASSTTTLTVAPATIIYGDTATLTAVVAPAFATGTVSFYEGTTLLGTASLDSTATAVLPISTLNAGVHSIVAKYNGDPGVPANTSNTAQLTVTQRTAPGGGPAITVTVNDASRTTTQSNPPFTYSAAGQLVNGDTYATAISGTPSYSTSGGSTAGTYSISVSGLDSANYTIAFVPGTLTVTSAPSTTTLVANPASTQYGDPVTLTATVTSGATGTVSFYDGSVLLGTGQVTNGIATLTTTTLAADTHTVTAVYNGDATYASSQSGPATVTVAKKQGAGGGAALTITVQNASRQYDTADPQFAYVVTGTLVNNDSYATAVTGTPLYSSTDTAISPAGSTFPISVSGLSSANYTTAFVNGTLTIVSAPTTTALTASTASAQYGDPVTLTATVAPSGATGTVLFMNGSTVLGTGTVTNGVATLTISSLPAGSYTITSTYEGDTNYSASTSAPVSLTINQRTGPGGVAALTVTVTNASRGYGQGNPAFNYTVTGALVNGDTYATAIAGVPVYSTTAIPLSSAGGYPISLAGLNSQNYLITVVNATLTVTKDTPGQNGVANITLTSSLNPSLYGNSVIFTASVPAPATGTVQFYDGATALGTGTIADGIATLTTSTLTVGTHPVTAVYSGDVDYNSATSAMYSQIVTAQAAVLDFTLTLTSAQSQTVLPGASAPYTVRVAPTNTTYPGTVTFSATGLPAGATISFSPATVASNGGPTAINVSVQTASQVTADVTGKLGKNTLSVALGLLLLPFVGPRRLRKNGRAAGRYVFLMLVLLGGIVATTGLTGCGITGVRGNGFFGQAPQTYNITITATSGTIQHSVNVTLNVE
ncbi:MAG TPA: Ig-like domain repeat protein [Acidobacteriaceae bacterium]|nr:Ig-like domain repeat protein [Acidobacteriaceae bacterium]